MLCGLKRSDIRHGGSDPFTFETIAQPSLDLCGDVSLLLGQLHS